jgi:hypothetical protein
MNIDRRTLLQGSACLALTGLSWPSEAEGQDGMEGRLARWHPLTRSLLDRAQRASSAATADASRIEGVIRQVARAQGWAKPPIIKWLADPSGAFDHLSRYGLDALLQMAPTRLWGRAGPSAPFDDRSLELSLVLGGVIRGIVGAEDHDRALMAPKLLSKSKAIAGSASAEAVFEVRAVAAQIGWLETCMPVAAAQAVANVELLLSSGLSEHDEPIHHQLRVFEAYELGLLATWETPGAIICVPRTPTV